MPKRVKSARGLTPAELAARVGVSESAVRKAMTGHRLTVRPDGTLDPELAPREWVENRRRAPGAGRKRAAPPVDTPQSRAAAAVGGEKPPLKPPISEKTLLELAIEHERVKIQQRRLDVRKKRGELVAWRRYRQEIFEMVRRERDHWVTWPGRIAKAVADEFALELGPVQIALEGHMRTALRELAQKLPLEQALIPAEARGDGRPARGAEVDGGGGRAAQ